MSEFVQMPDVNELKSELEDARVEIQAAIEEQPELAEQSKFMLEVLDILNEKIANQNDLSTLAKNEKISIIAHLNLFYSLLEDLFGDDMDFDDEDLMEFEDEDEEEEESEKK